MADRGLLLSRPLTWRVCHAVAGLLGADGGSITVGSPAVNRVTLCVTDRRSGLLDNLQDVLGEGPCREAVDAGRPCEAPLRQAASRWPSFTPAAEKIIGPDGVVWAIPMRAAGEVIGAISLYRLLPGPLAASVGDAVFLADAAAEVLLQDPLAFAIFTGPAEGGWSSRALVNQAAGMVMSQLGVCAGDAMAVLRSCAFAADTQLADIARQVLDRRLDLSAA